MEATSSQQQVCNTVIVRSSCIKPHWNPSHGERRRRKLTSSALPVWQLLRFIINESPLPCSCVFLRAGSQWLKRLSTLSERSRTHVPRRTQQPRSSACCALMEKTWRRGLGTLPWAVFILVTFVLRVMKNLNLFHSVS